ncbi:hypothetical protein F2Q70_00000911 [Brassica cretica]|uniref:Uncharacterized protein n=1 Tax=Brassica cretica TaxID=69181 RepID=A0A8S9IRL4_BRACR|nr:hypothetical protein F2Q70_00000911 [Brassica cretica]
MTRQTSNDELRREDKGEGSGIMGEDQTVRRKRFMNCGEDELEHIAILVLTSERVHKLKVLRSSI